MSLNPGRRLGPYEVVAAIGAGGMGEVYRATDLNLKRSVAIKVLPASVAGDVDRLARFQREAEVLAALNHPNIAAIFGLEKTPDVTALVMEFIDGEDLSELIRANFERRRSNGEVLEWALPIARQIAEALEAAHEQGIVHRDLKPGNIKVRPDGAVKVLDFGLAKAMDPAGGAAGADAMNSPTLTARATQMGTILGTAAYMAPEQARGKVVDRRADIWAFGVVLYEMLSGRRAFEGEDVSVTLANVIKEEVKWDALPSDLPPAIRRLIYRCLEKDPRRRLRDIGEARLVFEGGPDSGGDPTPAPVARRSGALVWPLAAMALASLAIAAYALLNRAAPGDTTAARLTIALPAGAEITSYPAITRDGRTVAYVARMGAEDGQLYLRDLDAFDARTVAASAGAKQPFFSPDGRWIAFFAQGQLQKAEVKGGAPIRVADAAYSFGGTWAEDNTIIYVTSLGSGLMRVPAGGGTPESLTKPDGAAKGYAHVFPQVLPGGRRVLFTVWGQTQGGAVLSLDSGTWELVLPTSSFGAAAFDAAGGATGRLLIADQSADVRAAPLDPAHPSRTSADTSILQGVYYEVETESQSWLAISSAGTAVYAPGNPARCTLVWVGRDGTVEPAGKDEDLYREVSLSPDGTKAVVRHGLDLWVHDLQRGTRTPLTSASGSNILPLWSRDGRQILFASNRGGDWDIYVQPSDGSRQADVLLKRPSDQFPYSILPDGTLLYTEIQPKTGRDIWTLSSDGKTSPVRVTQFNELAPQFSPGPAGAPRWIAYASDESGRSEVYVQSYPGGEHRIPVSNGGGTVPMWSPDGTELSYLTSNGMVVAAIRPDGTVGAPRKLFDRSALLINDRFHSYGVSPDGKRFLAIQREPGSVPRQLNVILNWGR